MSSPASNTHENRLAHETSPYLRQHKHNPVDWGPWGPDARAAAERLSRHDPKSVEQNRGALMSRLSETARPKGKVVIGPPELDRAAAQIAGMIDPVHGGMRGAPKFPQPMMLEFLWRAGQRLN